MAARSLDEIECVAASIRDLGGRAIAVRTDVTDAFALGSLATVAVDEFGHLDIWVNNAGGAEVGEPLSELTQPEWNEVVKLNFTSGWNGSMEAVEQMHWGSIIKISSMSAYTATPGTGHHAAACKAAVISLTRTMAVELAPDVRVDAIAPGMIATKLLCGAIDTEQLDLDDVTARVPLGLGTPADVGAAAVYLASPAARWVTGQTIEVNGGMTVA